MHDNPITSCDAPRPIEARPLNRRATLLSLPAPSPVDTSGAGKSDDCGRRGGRMAAAGGSCDEALSSSTTASNSGGSGDGDDDRLELSSGDGGCVDVAVAGASVGGCGEMSPSPTLSRLSSSSAASRLSATSSKSIKLTSSMLTDEVHTRDRRVRCQMNTAVERRVDERSDNRMNTQKIAYNKHCCCD